MSVLPELGITDYTVFSLILATSCLVGILSSLKASNSPADFLTASRSMHYIPVGLSLLTSLVSATGIIGFSGDVYAHGIQKLLFPVGSVFGIILARYLTLPVLANLPVTSMTEYLLLRFESKWFQKFVSVMYLSRSIIYMGVSLYAPTIALAAVTTLDIHTYIYVLGTICTIYSTVGGIRAVIWADVFQFATIIVGVLAVCIVTTAEAGGLLEAWKIAEEGNRTTLFNTEFDLTVPTTVWNSLAIGLCLEWYHFGVCQFSLQRIKSVANENEARKLLAITAVGLIVITTPVFLAGVASYAVYAGCDPIALGLLEKPEGILPFLILERSSHLYGLPGLFIAALFSGSLSSVSSVLSGAVAVVWKDFLESLKFFRNSSPGVATMANRILSMLIGCLMILMAILFTKTKSLIELHLITTSVVVGPIFGVFLLGMLLPWSNIYGAWAGLLSSWGFILWISLGSRLYPSPQDFSPLSIDSCNTTEEFRRLSSDVLNWTDITTYSPDETSTPVFYLYRIAYTLYPLISIIICVTIGVLTSLLTGKSNGREVSPTLISPVVRKYFLGEDRTQNDPNHRENGTSMDHYGVNKPTNCAS